MSDKPWKPMKDFAEAVSATLPGVIDTTYFRGVLIAATEDGVFYLKGKRWTRLEPAEPDIRTLEQRRADALSTATDGLTVHRTFSTDGSF